MSENKDTIVVNATVELTTQSLETIVDLAKQIAGRNEKGYYQVDTAGMVGRMISRFLLENDFESFVKNSDNYT